MIATFYLKKTKLYSIFSNEIPTFFLNILNDSISSYIYKERTDECIAKILTIKCKFAISNQSANQKMSKFINQISQLKKQNKKALAVLIDPDQPVKSVSMIAQLCQKNHIDFILVGGSLVTSGILSETISAIQSNCSIPVYIFPGNEFMIDEQADGILFLSLLSGRNPEYLIGKQVVAAPQLAASNLDVVPTAYLLIDGGKETSVSYISNTKPIPADKPDIAAATALAGKLMGMQCIYMDAGSGAKNPVPENIVAKVNTTTGLPIIIGGGIRTASAALELYRSGADMLVIGNGVEERNDLIEIISKIKNDQTLTVEI